MTASCVACHTFFQNLPDDDKSAEVIGAAFPNCACEACSVGQGSPGPIADDEILYRILVSPRDYDPLTKVVLERPFNKVFQNGLSIGRSVAIDEELIAIAEDGMHRPSSDPPRQVWAVLQLPAASLRAITDENQKREFAVYDQTVPRFDKSMPPIATHGSIFMIPLPKKTEDRKRLQKDLAGKLKELFLANGSDIESFREGIFIALNDRAGSPEFIF